jgi:toxin YoeB
LGFGRVRRHSKNGDADGQQGSGTINADRSTPLRVLDLIEAVLRDPFQGPGKAEPLRFLLAGCRSRRITQEHRLVYRVGDERIDFLQGRYDY